MKQILSLQLNKLIKILFNTKYPRIFYIIFFNLRLKLKGTNDRIVSVKINGNQFFRIYNLQSKKEKYFYYREQGFYAFKNGIVKRGWDLGYSYLIDNISFENSIVI
jgi:hypothetical protein